MLFPGIGEVHIPQTIRLLVALSISVAFALASPQLVPALPQSTIMLSLLLISEVGVGVSFGLVLRIMLSSMHTLGLTITTQSGLASAMLFDPSQGTQSSPFGILLTMFAVVLIFAFDLHLVLISDLAHSYQLFAVGEFFAHTEDFAMLMVKAANTAFNMGIKMAMPFIIVGSVVYMAAGVISRLMPNLQIFMLMIPAQIAITLWFAAMSISGIMLWFLDYYQDTYHVLWGG